MEQEAKTQLKLHAIVLELNMGGKFVLQSMENKGNSLIKILIGDNVFVPLSTHSEDMKLFSKSEEAITVASSISRTDGIRNWPLYKHVYSITLAQM